MVRIRWEVLIGVCLMLSVMHARAAWAQQEQPPGPFVIDVRGAFAGFKPTDATATPFGLLKAKMPNQGLGLDLGVHVYPLRRHRLTLGLGGSWLSSRGEKVPDAKTAPTDPRVKEWFSALSTQLSLNFGSSNGWSYISGGIGTAKRAIRVTQPTTSTTTTTTTTTSTSDVTPEGRRTKAINYGGGARWFASSHFAFGFDLRWYAVNPALATTTVPELPRQTLFVANAGISIH
jgi:hypothetical protein